MTDFPKEGLVRIDLICGDPKKGIPAFLPIGRTSFWKGVRSGKYPKPIKLGERTTCWRAEEIRALVNREKADE